MTHAGFTQFHQPSLWVNIIPEWPVSGLGLSHHIIPEIPGKVSIVLMSLFTILHLESGKIIAIQPGMWGPHAKRPGKNQTVNTSETTEAKKRNPEKRANLGGFLFPTNP